MGRILDKIALEKLKSDYARYLAINARQRTPGYENHGLAEAAVLQCELMESIPGLLCVCEAYLGGESLVVIQAAIDATELATARP